MKKKIVKPKKISKAKRIKKLRGKAWELMSLFTRLKWADDKGFVKCVTCGKVFHYTKMNAGHFVHGTPSHGYQYDYIEENINPQCVRCNKWLHGNLIQYTTFIALKHGEEMVKLLQKEGEKKIVLGEFDLSNLIIALEDKLKRAQNGEYNVI